MQAEGHQACLVNDIRCLMPRDDAEPEPQSWFFGRKALIVAALCVVILTVTLIAFYKLHEPFADRADIFLERLSTVAIALHEEWSAAWPEILKDVLPWAMSLTVLPFFLPICLEFTNLIRRNQTEGKMGALSSVVVALLLVALSQGYAMAPVPGSFRSRTVVLFLPSASADQKVDAEIHSD